MGREVFDESGELPRWERVTVLGGERDHQVHFVATDGDPVAAVALLPGVLGGRCRLDLACQFERQPRDRLREGTAERVGQFVRMDNLDVAFRLKGDLHGDRAVGERNGAAALDDVRLRVAGHVLNLSLVSLVDG